MWVDLYRYVLSCQIKEAPTCTKIINFRLTLPRNKRGPPMSHDTMGRCHWTTSLYFFRTFILPFHSDVYLMKPSQHFFWKRFEFWSIALNFPSWKLGMYYSYAIPRIPLIRDSGSKPQSPQPPTNHWLNHIISLFSYINLFRSFQICPMTHLHPDEPPVRKPMFAPAPMMPDSGFGQVQVSKWMLNKCEL